MGADLHLHSHFSDGTFTPEEIAAHAKRHGLTTIALTDHDTMEGCERTAAACRKHGIGFVPGSELTAEFDGREIHVLGYHLDAGHDGLTKALERFREVRRNRIVEMVERIQGCGVALSLDQVREFAKCDSPGRPHVARALVHLGVCSSYKEAFDRFLKLGKPAWIPKCRVEAAEIIGLIQAAGGVAVLAHPGIYNLDDRLEEIRDLGLDGIECYHSQHSFGDIKRYLEFAEATGLLVTGGSDCHGMSRREPLIGSIRIKDENIAVLRERAADRAGSEQRFPV